MFYRQQGLNTRQHIGSSQVTDVFQVTEVLQQTTYKFLTELKVFQATEVLHQTTYKFLPGSRSPIGNRGSAPDNIGFLTNCTGSTPDNICWFLNSQKMFYTLQF